MVHYCGELSEITLTAEPWTAHNLDLLFIVPAALRDSISLSAFPVKPGQRHRCPTVTAVFQKTAGRADSPWRLGPDLRTVH